ncbi:S8 family serine peptidase [Pseudoalteromonas sp. SCSIO 43201]|uniref:S8 family serine peptidase n=1 Tax=Pseudoalteromonas sp. SCSIO 43201 TaxID=2822842 RepID=UPI002075E86F|nr:S8 family serine peptidase [Pseudoalteromonas sp. SCSIO 43201]USD30725.1 S8 family serine peptidase [Pseudoalteromonas sp. SCSIO 43201]
MKNSKKATKFIKLSALSVCVCASLSSVAQADTQRVIVTLKDNATTNVLPLQLNDLEAAHLKSQILSEAAYTTLGTTALGTLPSVNAYVAEVSPAQMQQLQEDKNIAQVEIDPKRYLPAIEPTAIDLLAEATPYGIRMVQADQVSDSYSSNRKVCIMDTGYTLGHQDLPSTGITGNDGYGNYDTGLWSNDGNGHGTHVAGTIAALGGNGTGVVGVNPSGQLGLHIVKVFNDQGRWAYGSNLIKAIEQCEQAGANVTSMSLGGSGSSTAERNAFEQSYQRGMLHIAAAGNGGNSSLSYPASYDAVVSVAAVDSSESKASFSQYNSQVEIAGPGVGVNSTWNNGAYRSISGTSMATPHVSGVAALVWSQFPQCTAKQIRNVLNATAKDKGQAGRDTSYGHGIVQAKAAVDYLTANGCDTSGAVNANFSVAVDGMTATFSNQSTSGRYQWQFGDGATSSQTNPSHTYASAGTYQVTLTVTAANNKTASKTVSVTVDGAPTGCKGIQEWNATKRYYKGDRVSFKGFEYKATYWSQGASPEIYSNVWTKVAQCK